MRRSTAIALLALLASILAGVILNHLFPLMLTCTAQAWVGLYSLAYNMLARVIIFYGPILERILL